MRHFTTISRQNCEWMTQTISPTGIWNIVTNFASSLFCSYLLYRQSYKSMIASCGASRQRLSYTKLKEYCDLLANIVSSIKLHTICMFTSKFYSLGGAPGIWFSAFLIAVSFLQRTEKLFNIALLRDVNSSFKNGHKFCHCRWCTVCNLVLYWTAHR